MEKRATLCEEKHIINLMKSLYSNRKVVIGDFSFEPKCGIMQGSVMSSQLFNAILDDALNKNEVLSNFIKEGKLISFADDILGIVSSKEEAGQFLESIKSLEEYGLKMNKQKTRIISDDANLLGMKLDDIEVVQSFKFLGMSISCDRKLLLRDAKKLCSKFVAALKGKIRSKNSAVE